MKAHVDDTIRIKDTLTTDITFIPESMLRALRGTRQTVTHVGRTSVQAAGWSWRKAWYTIVRKIPVQVGDRVRIKHNPNNSNTEVGNDLFVQEMYNMIGKVYTVNSIWENETYHIGGFGWNREDFTRLKRRD